MLSALILTTVMAAAEGQQDYAYQHLKELECFIGDWEGKGVVPESPANSDTVQKLAGKPIVLRSNVSWAPGKCAQVLRNTWEVPGEITIQAVWVRGWDQTSKAIKVYSFTTHKGAWSSTMKKEGDKWITELGGVNLDGSKCTGTTTTVFKDDGTFMVTESRTTVDGKPGPDWVYTFTRVKTEPPVPNSERLKDLGFIIGREAEKPEYNPLLEPIAYMVGEWEMEKKSLLGELRATRRESAKWSADGQLLLTDLKETNADGSEGSSAFIVYYWDPELQTIKCHAYFSGNFREEQTLFSSDKDKSEQMWDSKWIFPNGNVGRFKCKITYDADSFTMVWSKVSGAGPADVGPFVNKRVKK